MRLATCEHVDALRPALAVGDRLVDVSAAAQRAGIEGDPRTLATVRALLTGRADDLERLHEAAAQLTAAGESVALADVRLGPPIPTRARSSASGSTTASMRARHASMSPRCR